MLTCILTQDLIHREDVFKSLAKEMVKQIGTVGEEQESFKSIRNIQGEECSQKDVGIKRGGPEGDCFNWRLHTLRVAALHELEGGQLEAARVVWREIRLDDSEKHQNEPQSEVCTQLSKKLQQLVSDEARLNDTLEQALVDCEAVVTIYVLMLPAWHDKHRLFCCCFFDCRFS